MFKIINKNTYTKSICQKVEAHFLAVHLSMQESKLLTKLPGDLHCTTYHGANRFPSHLLIRGSVGITFCLVKFSLANYVLV